MFNASFLAGVAVLSFAGLAVVSPAAAEDLAADREICATEGQQSTAACTRLIEAGVTGEDLLDAYLNRGIDRLNSGDPEGALRDADELLRLDPEDPWGHLLKGNAHLALDNGKKAVAAMNRAIKLDPNFAQAYSARGKVYRRSGQYDRALVDHNKAVELDPWDHAVVNGRGVYFLYAKQYRKALADFVEATRLDPDYTIGHNNRGEANRLLGRHEAAIDAYKEAIRRGHENPATMNNLAWELVVVGNYAEAVVFAEQALAGVPGKVGYLDTLGHALMGLGKQADAEAAFGKAIDADNGSLTKGYQAALKAKGYRPGRADGNDRPSLRKALAACIRDNCRLMLD